MKKVILISVILFFIIAVTIFFFLTSSNPKNILSPVSIITEKPLEKYEFQRLRNRVISAPSNNIEVGAQLKNTDGFSSYIFYFTADNKKVSGMMNIPTKSGKYPVLLLLRGYIDQQIYTTGDGTRRDGEIFAQNGFITLAPDFLGYGESASPSANPVEERFQTYTTTLDLISSVSNINRSLSTLTNNDITADTEKIGIWGHSNGGQIALSILSITGKSYPTVLWAPVTKPFPYSVLYYTDEFDDHGKKLRKVISDFEKDYDVELFTFTNYIDWIAAPIQLHQGISDEEVPQKWSDQIVAELKDKRKDITYFTYLGEDHNFTQGSWSVVINRNIVFYKNQFR